MNHRPTTSSLLSLLIGCALVAACTTEADVDAEVGDYGADDHGDSQADQTGAVAATTPALSWPTVDLGDSNQDVTTAQYLLLFHGESASLDGVFDASMQAAVRRLQQSRGIVADGVVGDATWLALISDVERGQSGPAVQAVQYLLKNRFAASIDVTGQFGPTTELRVQELQAKVCLQKTGIVGRYTWNALVARRSY